MEKKILENHELLKLTQVEIESLKSIAGKEIEFVIYYIGTKVFAVLDHEF